MKTEQGATIAPALLVRIRTAVERGCADPKFASQVGLLFIQRLLTGAEAATAFRIAEIYGRFESINGLRRTVRSPGYEMGSFGQSAGAPLDDDTLTRIENDRAAWIALRDELDAYPDQVRAQLEALCVEDAAISSGYLDDVRKVLRKLASFFNSNRARPKKRKKKRGALVLVGREHTGKTAPVPSEPRRRIDHERSAWLAVQKKLRPDLDARQLQEAFEIFVAMKERAAFNDEKGPTGRS